MPQRHQRAPRRARRARERQLHRQSDADSLEDDEDVVLCDLDFVKSETRMHSESVGGPEHAELRDS
eukprot:2505709-Alexandrium_andersonii.AAC.1